MRDPFFRCFVHIFEGLRGIPPHGLLLGADPLRLKVPRDLRVPLFPDSLRVPRGFERLAVRAVVASAYGTPSLPSSVVRRLVLDVIKRPPFRFIFRDGT